MRLLDRTLMLLALMVPGAASCQVAITPESILGVWIADEGVFVTGPSGCLTERHRLLAFRSNNELEVTTLDDVEKPGCEPTRRTSSKKNADKSTPAEVPIDVAYVVGESICTLGEKKGQLYLVTGSSRCCFKAYHLAGKLILDDIRPTNWASLGPIDICSSNTYTLLAPGRSERNRNSP